MLNIKRLNNKVDHPSFLLSLNDVSILLDCPVNVSNIDSQKCANAISPPNNVINSENKDFWNGNDDEIEWEMIDAILISNTWSLVLLPYLSEMKNFRGKVLTTEPVLRLGKVIIEDILKDIENMPPDNKLYDESKEKLNGNNRNWMLEYTREQAKTAFSKIQTVAYHEFVNLFGLLQVKCVSAGYEIGSCNWVLKTSNEKVVYLSRSSLHPSFAMPMDFSDLSGNDILIVGSVNVSNSRKLDEALEHFRIITAQTLARGGHVLVPTLPSGPIFQLFENVVRAKEEFNGNLLASFDVNDGHHRHQHQHHHHNHHQNQQKAHQSSDGTSDEEKRLPGGGVSLMGKVDKCPLLFISSQCKASLTYANASGEWLAPDRENALYAADSPFAFNQWIKSGQLVTLTSLHSSPSFACTNQMAVAEGSIWPSSPCVLFTGHPSCRLGSAVHLLRALAHGAVRTADSTSSSSPHHAIVLVQSDDFLFQDSFSSNFKKMALLLEPFDKRLSEGLKKLEPEVSEQINAGKNCPISTCRLGQHATVYWLPIRPDLSTDQLSTLLVMCGTPSQALILPTEIGDLASILPVSSKKMPCDLHRLAPDDSISIPLKSPTLIPIHLDACLTNSLLPLTVGGTGSTPASITKTIGKPSDPRTAAKQHGIGGSQQQSQYSPAHVALVDGFLCFRDGQYHLKGMEKSPDSSGKLAGHHPSSPYTPSGRPASPSGSSTPSSLKQSAAGAPRLLISRTPINPHRLIKELTECGVTGAQIAEPAHLSAYFHRQRQFISTLDVNCLLAGDSPKPSNCALILFPNSSTTILLTETGSHVSCLDEGTRQAIRNSIISCTDMTCVPASQVNLSASFL